MKLVTNLSYVDFYELKRDIIFIESFYDCPIKGTIDYNGDLCYFELRDWGGNESYDIYILNLFECWQHLYRKVRFEFCVGKHWSY